LILAPFGANSTTRREAPCTLPWVDLDDPGLSGYFHDAFCTLRVPDYDKRGPQTPRDHPGRLLRFEIVRDQTTRSEGTHRPYLDIPPCKTSRGVLICITLLRLYPPRLFRVPLSSLLCHVSALPCPPSLRSLRISSVYAIGRPPTVPSHPFIVLIVCAPRLHAAQAHPLCDRAVRSRVGCRAASRPAPALPVAPGPASLSSDTARSA
jgi:hypothetical protein